MIKNLHEGWKTTVLGLLFIAASITSVYVKDHISWTDITIPVAIGIGLLFSPDDVLNRVRNLLKSDSSDTSDIKP